MANVATVQATKSPARARTATAARLFFVDYWRVGLAILVVLHHVAMVYGASIPFYYMEPPLTDPLANIMGATNAITYECDLAGPITLVGAGAGRLETGLLDQIEIAEHNSRA